MYLRAKLAGSPWDRLPTRISLRKLLRVGQYSGWITLGSTMKRATDRLYAAVDGIYRADGLAFQAAWYPVFQALRDPAALAGLAVSEVAARIGQSHVAVSHVSKKLEAAGWVASAEGEDRRRRVLTLTRRGRALAARLRDLWIALDMVLAERLGTAQCDLLGALAELESELDAGELADEVLSRARMSRTQSVQFESFAPQWADAFAALNFEWLEAHFEVEPHDREVLEDPDTHVIGPGGEILFALLHGEVVGTCALIQTEPSVFELSKMAVTEPCQGLGLGRLLMHRALERFAALGAERLFLESHHSLKPAIALYESCGFRHTPRPAPSVYARADVYMVYRPDTAA